MSTDSIQVRFDKSHLITIGEKLYGESMELIRELVSNSYDADAEHVWIEVTPTTLSVRDDGWGMNEAGLREYFTIGSQNKRLAPVSLRFHRPRIGQFGIGKFAVLSACKRFRVRTQQSDFSAEIVFDKENWESGNDWNVPLVRMEADPESIDGTIVTLEHLSRLFALPDIERFIRERLPLTSPHFSIFLNGRLLEPTIIPGRRFPINSETPYGPIRGEFILPNVGLKKGEAIGIECVVRSVVICRTTFGFELPILSRLRGRVSVDFLPITSDRSRFILDSPEYRAFIAVIYKELLNISHLLKDIAEQKEQQKADETLKDTLSRMRKAIRKNPDIAPSMMSASGEVDPFGRDSGAKMAPQEESGESDAEEVFQMTVSEKGMQDSENTPSNSLTKEAPPKKVRVKNLHGKTVIARSIVVGGIGITCALENCGKQQAAAFTEAGIVYINIDHPLYKKQAEKGQEMLGFYLTYLLSQQVALLLSEGDTRKAFETQNRLLTDSCS